MSFVTAALTTEISHLWKSEPKCEENKIELTYNFPNKLYIKKLHPNAKIPTRGNPTDAGLDLYSVENGVVPPRGKVIVPTGIAIKMEIPVKYTGFALCMQIMSRSGLSAKHSIEKGAGLIDQDYRGEIKIILFNHSDQEYEYKIGDRIAQAMITPVLIPEIIEVDELDETNRGVGGFGSTGK